VAGNLTGRGMWRVLSRRWARRLDRLISMLSGEAMRNGTSVTVPTLASHSSATAGVGEGPGR
jgi:hypothetical protein